MFLVRNVFTAKPGQAKALVEKFKAASPLLAERGVANRIMTDVAAGFWNVVVESEVDDLGEYFDMARRVSQVPEVKEAMAGYMDHVVGGHREIWNIE